ncbi:copper chaperone PCu(A)C [Erythrobacter litoralis]|uniref:copper chaperone PCu(A)C n=1 Tax=Erythrobacter litoralis TaxID=39960 RepID=UPI0024351B90|nr:copper chaperone PCu(A)C [Erythrobacter litoralis]MDG6078141.1 copper chaperone PCu(A)C [Erythrobacter litoralis]
MNSRLFAAAFLLGSGTVLASCGGNSEEPVEQQAPEGVEGLSIENPRLILPAVAGNPGVVYFDLVNDSDRNYAVRRADVEGAGRTEMHGSMEMYDGEIAMSPVGPQTVMANDTFTFEPGGFHVMVFDLSPELQAGGETEMTLTVAGGDKASFAVPIQSPGDAR